MCGCFDLDFGGEYAVIFVFEIGERLGGMVRESRFLGTGGIAGLWCLQMYFLLVDICVQKWRGFVEYGR